MTEPATIRTCGLEAQNPAMQPAFAQPPVAWRVEPGLVDYEGAVAAMEARVAAIISGAAPELVWLVEHPPLYTAGTSAKDADLIDARFPVHRAGRGGQFTYHGPGQRVAYIMLDLNRRRPDVRAFVCALEAWIIASLARFNVTGETREGRVGVWVRRPDKTPGLDGSAAEDKIAAIGIRMRRWTTFHGLAINVEPDLSHFHRHHALRRPRGAFRRHKPRRSRPARDDGRCRRGVAPEF